MSQWTPALVRARLREAAFTHRLMPDPDRKFQARLRALWPDIPSDRARNPERWWGNPRTERAREPRILPTAAQIDRLDEVTDWLTWLTPPPAGFPADISRMLWARASRRSWRWIRHRRQGVIGANGEDSLRRSVVMAEEWLARRLNSG